jgi:hypothetical protein
MTLKLKPLVWGGVDYPYAKCPITGKEFSLCFEQGAFYASWDLNLPGSNDLEALKQAAEEHRVDLVQPHVEEEELAMADFDPRTLSEDEKDQAILDMQAHLDKLTAILEDRMDDVRLVSYVNGVLDLEGTPVAYIAEYLAQMLEGREKNNPANYMEMSITHNRLGELTMSLQRQSGKSPHQLRKEADYEVSVFKSRILAAIESYSREIKFCSQALNGGAISEREHLIRNGLLCDMKGVLTRIMQEVE